MVRSVPDGGPIIEQIAGEYEGKLKVAKVDVDANQQVSMVQYPIDSEHPVLQGWSAYR
jgi:hypothetical protein